MALPSLLARTGIAIVTVCILVGCSGESGSQVIGNDESSQEPGGDEQSGDSADARDLKVESGFTSGVDPFNTRYTLAGARVTNPNADYAAYDVQVLFNLLGKDGQVLDSQTETVAYVGPNESVPVAPLQIGIRSESRANRP